MKSLIVALFASALSVSANAAVLTENFDAVPGWEAGWFGANSNAQNYYGAGQGRGNNPDGLWVGSTAGNTTITFSASFAQSLTSFALDVGGFSPTTLSFYDKNGSLLLSTPVALTYGATTMPGTYSRYSVSSANGIGGFSFSDGAYGNTGIDNLVATTAGAGVPEPATWALMAGGFGLVGAMRRRRAAAVAA